MSTNITPTTNTTIKKEKPNYKYLRDKDRQMVKGIFRFHEVPGGSLSFSFKCWKEDPVERFDMVDGAVYTIPLGVAKHLNKNVSYSEYGFLQGESGTIGAFSHAGHVMKVTKKIRRCSFQSLEFIDLDDIGGIDSTLVQVETLV